MQKHARTVPTTAWVRLGVARRSRFWDVPVPTYRKHQPSRHTMPPSCRHKAARQWQSIARRRFLIGGAIHGSRKTIGREGGTYVCVYTYVLGNQQLICSVKSKETGHRRPRCRTIAATSCVAHVYTEKQPQHRQRKATVQYKEPSGEKKSAHKLLR